MKVIKNGMRPIHPGEVLREEFLVPMRLTAHALAIALHAPALRISDIVRERRAVSVDTLTVNGRGAMWFAGRSGSDSSSWARFALGCGFSAVRER